MKLETTERLCVWEDKIYLIRDVRLDGRQLRCEYATTPGNGEPLTWTKCEEGSKFESLRTLLAPKPVKLSPKDTPMYGAWL